MRMLLFFAIACSYFPPSLFATEAVPGKSKVVLVTGASRGIGWETAKKLAAAGHRVYASSRSPQSVPAAPDLATLYPIAMDLADEESVTQVFAMLHEKEGHLDVVINNAGCAAFGVLETVSIEQVKKTFEVNVFGVMRVMQAALPLMRKQKQGLIINVSSTSGVRPSPGWDIYAASKFAIEGLSEAVAAVAKLWNIDVVLLEPGATATDFMQQSTEVGTRRTEDTEVYARYVPHVLKWMQDRLADGQNPAEVAALVASIVASEQRQLRYQTNAKGRQTVASRHVDPSGVKSLREQETLVRQLWHESLEDSSG